MKNAFFVMLFLCGTAFGQEAPFLSKNLLKEDYLRVFPNGFHINEENVQKLIDNGIDVDNMSFPVTGKFTIHGNVCHYKNSKLHCDDGPAAIYKNGTIEYYRNGLRHRDDGPAVFNEKSYKAYYKNGKLHREDGPAVIYKNGIEKYYLNGITVKK